MLIPSAAVTEAGRVGLFRTVFVMRRMGLRLQAVRPPSAWTHPRAGFGKWSRAGRCPPALGYAVIQWVTDLGGLQIAPIFYERHQVADGPDVVEVPLVPNEYINPGQLFRKTPTLLPRGVQLGMALARSYQDRPYGPAQATYVLPTSVAC